MIRLFIIEDHPTIVVSSFRFLFRPERDGISVAGYATTLAETISTADPANFDLFILDLHIPKHLPIDNIRSLKHHFQDKPIVIYTSEASNSWMRRMIAEGASAYLTKDATREELKLAIQRASRGEVFYFGPKASPGEVPEHENGSQQPLTLTPVQKEIVRMLAAGLTHKEISHQLGLSRSMIEKILINIRNGFHVKNNLELISLLTELGLIY